MPIVLANLNLRSGHRDKLARVMFPLEHRVALLDLVEISIQPVDIYS